MYTAFLIDLCRHTNPLYALLCARGQCHINQTRAINKIWAIELGIVKLCYLPVRIWHFAGGPPNCVPSWSQAPILVRYVLPIMFELGAPLATHNNLDIYATHLSNSRNARSLRVILSTWCGILKVAFSMITTRQSCHAPWCSLGHASWCVTALHHGAWWLWALPHGTCYIALLHGAMWPWTLHHGA